MRGTNVTAPSSYCAGGAILRREKGFEGAGRMPSPIAMGGFHVLQHHRFEVVEGNAAALASARGDHGVELCIVIVIAQSGAQLALLKGR
eukprot:scaffold228505_cov33-Tisochrysis_lutea.AAC.2